MGRNEGRRPAAQVGSGPVRSMGFPNSWRRYALFLAQVGFLVGDLSRKMDSYALQWRRSRPLFHTCAQKALHLRQKAPKAYPPALRCGKWVR